MENSQRLSLPRMPYKGERLGVMTGMLLGGASIVKKYQNNIVICHSNKFKEYFDWKCEILSKFGYSQKKIRQMRPVVKGNKHSASIVDFVGDDINWFYKNAYDQITGKKTVKYQFVRHLNQYGLAVWFMDDGSNVQKLKNGSYLLNTQAFSEEENKMLVKILKKRFGLEPKIHREKGKYYKLYFGAEKNNAQRLKELINSYIHPSMKYKLRWTPRNK
jgi:DNA-binding transcriptional regulator WhiA